MRSQCPMRSQKAHTARAALLVRATKSQILKAYCWRSIPFMLKVLAKTIFLLEVSVKEIFVI
jgi:hypothetical protein